MDPTILDEAAAVPPPQEPSYAVEAPMPARKPLSLYSVKETAKLLRDHFHVDPSVIEQGFLNVDGRTLSYYTEKDLEDAGVTNRPLRRRILCEVQDMQDEQPRQGSNPLATLGRIFSRGAVQSLTDLRESAVVPRRRRSLGAVVAPEPTIGTKPPPLVKRASTEWFRRSFGSRGSARKSRRDARLDEELRRYKDELPKFGILAIDPDLVTGGGDDDLYWTVRVEDPKTTDQTTLRVKIPSLYPFTGPTITYKGYDVQFEMGKHAQEFHDADAHILHVNWTPAQRIADAVLVTLDVVRRALLDEQQHVRRTSFQLLQPGQQQQGQQQQPKKQRPPTGAFT